jgi:Transglycosylase-like domain
VRVAKALHGPLVVLLGLVLVAPGGDVTAPSSGVDPAHLPSAAREFLPLITDLTARQCPELPPLWVVAQVEAESGWDPAVVGGGVAGLLQFDELTWMAAGGEAWPSPTPQPGDPVTDAEAHLRVAVPWLCGTLRAVAGHLDATGKPTSALDAMLVCHVAGCGRVTGSASGVPRAGEAGCARRCADLVARYLDAVHRHVREYTAAGPTKESSAVPVLPPAATPTAALDPASWTGGATGCTLPDPTGGRCLTGATKHGLDAAGAAFAGWKGGPAIRSAGCWDRHAWNPKSDHPQGRACDLFATKAGRFADGIELADGWRVAEWFRGHAGPLQVKYVIWQGRYWDPRVADQDGWGRRYSGGGVYDVRNATGGHYDHVHVSFRE